MPDIKIKPQMDKPKVRVANNTPKDAGSILKQEYMSQQREKQPDQKGPVQYATDRVETTGRRGTMATADGMRRIAGRARNKRKGQSADTKQENHLSETVLQEPGAAPKTGAQPNAERRAQTQYIQERREQLQADKTHSHSAKHFEFDKDAVYYPDNPSSRPYRFNQSPVQPAMRAFVHVMPNGNLLMNHLAWVNLKNEQDFLLSLLRKAKKNHGDCKFDRFVAHRLNLTKLDFPRCWLDNNRNGKIKSELEALVTNSVGIEMDGRQFTKFSTQFRDLYIAAFGKGKRNEDRGDRVWKERKINTKLKELGTPYQITSPSRDAYILVDEMEDVLSAGEEGGTDA